ncbi:hypothetical protein EV1_010550 [Malus domestica]
MESTAIPSAGYDFDTVPTTKLHLPKFSNPTGLKASQESSSWSFHGGLLLLSSVFNAEFAEALSNEEALGQTVSGGGGDLEVGGVLDSVISFVTDNPAVIAGGFAVLAVPLILSQVLKPPKPFGVDSARSAYAKLGEEANAQLLDIRSPADFRQFGTPDVKGLGKKAASSGSRFDGGVSHQKRSGMNGADSITRRSPTTPLSWSRGTGSPSAIADSFEESSCPISKGNAAYESTSTTTDT